MPTDGPLPGQESHFPDATRQQSGFAVIRDGPAAVLWDMDGTLLDSEKIWTVSLADTARWLGGELSQAARDDVVGSNMARTLTIMFDDLGLEQDADRKVATAEFLTARTGELFQVGLVWRPGAQEALRTVRDAGWPMALVTNTERALTEVALDAIGREQFAVTVCGDEVRRGKPEPDPYLRAAELLGVAAQECLAVEDSPTGALAATRAGASVLVVPCDVPVPSGPGRIHRESLVDLSPSVVRNAYARGRSDRDSTRHPAHLVHRAEHNPCDDSTGRTQHMTLRQ